MTPAMVRLAVILGLLSMLGPFSIDMYLPALPKIANDLQSSEAAAQATIVSYFIAYGLAQMIYGPWADSAGRRTPLMVGGAIFILGAIGSALSSTLESLIVWRAIQGLGGSALMIIPRAVIRDRYTGTEATRLMAMMLLVISVSPMLAPLAGTAVMSVTDWRAIFWILSLLAFASLSITFVALPETLEPTKRVAIDIKALQRNCAKLLTDPYFMGLTFVGGLGMSSFFVYLASSPFVFTGQYGLTSTQFSFAFAVNAIGFFAASQVAGPLADRVGLRQAIIVGTTIFALATITLGVLANLFEIPLLVLIAFLFVGNAGLGLVVPTTMVMALDPYGEIAGLASSLGGTLQLIFGGVLIAVTGLFFDGTLVPMVTVIALCGIGAVVLARLTLPAPVQSS